jgi:fucose permease
MFLFGFLDSIRGVSYPLIKNEFGVSYETWAVIVSVLAFGSSVLIIVSGFLLNHIKLKGIYCFALILCFLSITTIYFMPSLWTVAVSLIFLAAGFGIAEIAVNAVAAHIFVAKTALMMNLLHFMYGSGSIAGPKIAGILANPAGAALPWRQIYILFFPLVLVVFIPFIFSKFPCSGKSKTESIKTPETADPAKKHNFISALKIPSVWAFGIILGVGVGLELAPANWGSLYFQDMYGMDPTTSGANFVSSYYLCFTFSRLVSGFIIEKSGYIRSLIWAVIACTVIFAVGFAIGPKGIYVLPALGFFLAIIWPTIMAIAIGFYGKNAAINSSAIIAIAGTLNSGIQFAIGSIDHWAGAGWGYRSCFVFAVILTGLLLGFRKIPEKKA